MIACRNIYYRDSKIDPFWLDKLSKIEKPVARNLFAQLTTTNALGYESQSASARAGAENTDFHTFMHIRDNIWN